MDDRGYTPEYDLDTAFDSSERDSRVGKYSIVRKTFQVLVFWLYSVYSNFSIFFADHSDNSEY